MLRNGSPQLVLRISIWRQQRMVVYKWFIIWKLKRTDHVKIIYHILCIRQKRKALHGCSNRATGQRRRSRTQCPRCLKGLHLACLNHHLCVDEKSTAIDWNLFLLKQFSKCKYKHSLLSQLLRFMYAWLMRAFSRLFEFNWLLCFFQQLILFLNKFDQEVRCLFIL